MKLSIIIPVYNEEAALEIVLNRILDVKLPAAILKEILIVNDGSTDGSTAILQKYESQPDFRIFHLEQNQGKTKAIKLGIENADGEIIMIQDADLEYHPRFYPELIIPILDKRANIVYGSRFKGKIENMKWINRMANIVSCRTFNWLYKTNISDINTCFKVFTRETIKAVDIDSDHFSFETEVTRKLIKKGNTILEVPIEYSARTKLDGKKINWIKALEMYAQIFK